MVNTPTDSVKGMERTEMASMGVSREILRPWERVVDGSPALWWNGLPMLYLPLSEHQQYVFKR